SSIALGSFGADSAAGDSTAGRGPRRRLEWRRPPRRDRRRPFSAVVGAGSEGAPGSSSGIMTPTCRAEAELQWNYSKRGGFKFQVSGRSRAFHVTLSIVGDDLRRTAPQKKKQHE